MELRKIKKGGLFWMPCRIKNQPWKLCRKGDFDRYLKEYKCEDVNGFLYYYLSGNTDVIKSEG